MTEDGTFRFDAQSGDLYHDLDNASVLVEGSPAGDYLVETRVQLSVPPEGEGYNFAQAGLVIYGDVDRYIKLVVVAIDATRQTEFGKETPGGVRYGSTLVGPPGEWVSLRIVRRSAETGERYTAYTSRDGLMWVRGGTWTHDLGADARIGLVAMGASGHHATFDYVRVYSVGQGNPDQHAFADDDFHETWARTDKPVEELEGEAEHTWIWGPEPMTTGIPERYDDAPDGHRLVQYFDKSRMEITNPDAFDDDLWYVTNGLLVWEMVNGWWQVGDVALDESPEPANVNIAGDPGEHPTYADISTFGLLGSPGAAPGVVITNFFTNTGEVEQRQELEGYDVTVAHYESETGHSIALPFWEFMNAEAMVFIEALDAEDVMGGDGEYVTEKLFDNPFYATGYPITEAYWSRVRVAGEERDVLWQCFERRCLTYTPDNPAGFQVEASNAGQHYYRWRYGGE